MAKRARAQSSTAGAVAPVPPPQPIPGVMPGPLDIVDVVKTDEKWSEYTLKDKSVLRVKPTVIEVRRARGQYSPEGDPLYTVKFGVAISTVAPQKLKKKWRKGS